MKRRSLFKLIAAIPFIPSVSVSPVDLIEVSTGLEIVGNTHTVVFVDEFRPISREAASNIDEKMKLLCLDELNKLMPERIRNEPI